jgi:alanine racemase
METSQYSTWLEINLAQIKSNIRILQDKVKKPVMAVIKANAYGHGVVEVASAVQEVGCTWCAVARLEEALKLRNTGITCNLFVLGYTPPAAVPLAIKNDIHLTIYDRDTAWEYSLQALHSGEKVQVHVKIDTGMGRLGIFPEEGLDFLNFLASLQGLQIAGLFTHFARADEPDLPTTKKQIERFEKLVADLQDQGRRPTYVHASNSAGTICFPSASYDIVRPGIAIYGLSPSGDVTLPEGMKPALTWKSRITSVKILPPGSGVSYGHDYVTQKAERIGAIAAGYADGFRRIKGGVALVHGMRVPVVGRVCMDQAMLQLDDVPDAKVGEEVVLIGKQGSETISAEEIAGRWGTINYEVIASLADRLPRVYI